MLYKVSQSVTILLPAFTSVIGGYLEGKTKYYHQWKLSIFTKLLCSSKI